MACPSIPGSKCYWFCTISNIREFGLSSSAAEELGVVLRVRCIGLGCWRLKGVVDPITRVSMTLTKFFYYIYEIYRDSSSIHTVD